MRPPAPLHLNDLIGIAIPVQDAIVAPMIQENELCPKIRLPWRTSSRREFLALEAQ